MTVFSWDFEVGGEAEATTRRGSLSRKCLKSFCCCFASDGPLSHLSYGVDADADADEEEHAEDDLEDDRRLEIPIPLRPSHDQLLFR